MKKNNFYKAAAKYSVHREQTYCEPLFGVVVTTAGVCRERLGWGGAVSCQSPEGRAAYCRLCGGGLLNKKQRKNLRFCLAVWRIFITCAEGKGENASSGWNRGQ